MKKILLTSLLMSSMMMTACNTTLYGTASDGKTTPAFPLTDKTWIVTHINGEMVKTKASDRNIPSLTLDGSGQRFSGADGCNRIMGSYALIAPTTLTFGQVASSMMACLDENIQNTSSKYTQALAQVESYQITPTTLILKDKQGKSVIQLTSAVQPR